MTFLENISGFLFRPGSRCEAFLAEENFTRQFKRTILFVVYSSVILGIIFVFWTLLPETLYYGVSFDHEYRNLLFINLSNPTTLLIFFGIGFFLLVVYHFLVTGLINYWIGRIFAGNSTKTSLKQYYTVYGYSSTLPILLMGVFITFWIYFYEKLYLATEIPPFIDFTPPIIIFFSIFIGFLVWKWVIEMRMNQVFFNTSIIRAAIPELVQVLGFIGFIFLLGWIVRIFGATLNLV